MNLGVGEAVDIGFKLAATLNGYGGPLLLQSYNLERRPIMIRALERSDRHVREQMPWHKWAAENPELINAETPEGDALRKKIDKYLTESGSECTSRGIEIDSRYTSPFIYQDSDGTEEPEWNVFKYIPSTWPGMRAPHVFLKDGKTSIFDLYGKGWTLVEFTSSNAKAIAIPLFTEVASQRHIPLKTVQIQDEEHVRTIWERNIVLVRPDGHVAWRANETPSSTSDIREIFDVVLGKQPFPGWKPQPTRDGKFKSIIEKVENNPEGDPKFLAAFQKDVN